MTVTLVTMMLIVLVGVAELDERGASEARAAVPMPEPAQGRSRVLTTDPTALPSSGRAWPRAMPTDD
jgi:hypothetical protein